MKILLATDGSKFSDAATKAVIAQATPQHDEVRVLHVVDLFTLRIPENAYYPGIEYARDAERKIAEEICQAAKSLFPATLRVTTDIEWDNPKSKIIDLAAEWGADLIVLGSHGKTGLVRFLTGSVADAVMRHAPCSVEIVRIPPLDEVANRPREPQNANFLRTLLAIDDTRFSEAAAQFLSQQMQLSQAEVRVLYVIEPPTLLVEREMGGYNVALEQIWRTQIEQAEQLVTRVAETFRGKRLKVSTCVIQGDPRSEILNAAQNWEADLIVIGSHGRTSFERFLMGSVSDTVARHSRCSVEVVRIRPSD